MRAVIGYGAKGYIPMTMGFELAVEAVRFVLAGGTYVPAEYLLSAIPSAVTPSRPPGAGAITGRELAVVRAIHQGKPNKIIAYELNMCESTVKVHVRHIMKKLRAKNRTDVAIKATALLACSRCTTQSECWSAGRCSMRFA
jgi:DNA-binding NarL/FixJ family response regulator